MFSIFVSCILDFSIFFIRLILAKPIQCSHAWRREKSIIFQSKENERDRTFPLRKRPKFIATFKNENDMLFDALANTISSLKRISNGKTYLEDFQNKFFLKTPYYVNDTFIVSLCMIVISSNAWIRWFQPSTFSSRALPHTQTHIIRKGKQSKFIRLHLSSRIPFSWKKPYINSTQKKNAELWRHWLTLFILR